MATCPSGHDSAAPDYCDVCGALIGGAPASGAAPGASGAYAPPGGARPCPDCGTPGTDRFCEACGYDFATGGGRPTPRTEKSAPSHPTGSHSSAPYPSVPPAAGSTREPSGPLPAP
ncbi:phosphopeptide-binding protein, partial [Actinomadura sp. GC306]